jgi:hypothetical protein
MVPSATGKCKFLREFLLSGAGSRTFIIHFGNPTFFIGIPEVVSLHSFGNFCFPARVPELLLSTSGTQPFLSVFPKWSPFISSGFFASGAGSRTFIFYFGNPAFLSVFPKVGSLQTSGIFITLSSFGIRK